MNITLIPTCDSCGQDMELDTKFEYKLRPNSRHKYQPKRYHCSLCGTYTTTFSNEDRDEIEASRVLEELENIAIDENRVKINEGDVYVGYGTILGLRKDE